MTLTSRDISNVVKSALAVGLAQLAVVGGSPEPVFGQTFPQIRSAYAILREDELTREYFAQIRKLRKTKPYD